jgi:putative alpha-1,2-mannosidase
LGKQEDAALFARRADNWKHLWDDGTGWIRPRRMDGSWLEPFTPVCDAGNCPGFVESNSAIYTWFVPHDMPGLVAKMGGPEQAREKLLRQFTLAAPKKWITPHGRHGQNWTDMENQPSCHMAHLFSHLGAPWLTQEWVLRMKEEVFGDTTPYGGYNGDEDQGQMGALGVLMGVGLFDVTGGSGRDPRYEITTPVFDRVEIDLDARYYPGRRVTILKRGRGPYIQRARWNGQELQGRFWVTHAEFIQGGTLELETAESPNRTWGVAPKR